MLLKNSFVFLHELAYLATLQIILRISIILKIFPRFFYEFIIFKILNI